MIYIYCIINIIIKATNTTHGPDKLLFILLLCYWFDL